MSTSAAQRFSSSATAIRPRGGVYPRAERVITATPLVATSSFSKPVRLPPPRSRPSNSNGSTHNDREEDDNDTEDDDGGGGGMGSEVAERERRASIEDSKKTAAALPKRKSSEIGASAAATTATTTVPTTITTTTTTTTATRGENGEAKKKRRKVNHACVYCRRSHMTCDLERPCARCIKRDIGHLCHDEPRDPPKRSKSDAGVPDIAPAPGVDAGPTNGKGETLSTHGNGSGDGSNSSSSSTGNGNSNGNSNSTGAGAYGHRESNGEISTRPMTANGLTQLAPPHSMSPAQMQLSRSGGTSARNVNNVGNVGNAGSVIQNFDWNNSGMHNQFHDMHHLHPNYMFNTSEVSNEYTLLNDFLSSSLLDDPAALYSGDDGHALFNDPLLSSTATTSSSSSAAMNALASNLQPTTITAQSGLQPPSQLPLGQEISRPASTLPVDTRARDKFYMTAADPAGLESAESRLHKLLQAKYDAGMLKPFNHVKGYARLNQYMSQHLTRESQLRILKQLDRFRPKFREAMQSLTDMQLVMVEMWFEQQLMDYDRVFASMAIPACCWRRTGEIFRGNTEMAELLHRPMDQLRDGKLAIHEIIAEDSLVSYWEKFGAIAFDQSQKAILTSCSLKRPVKKPSSPHQDREGWDDGTIETIRCCFSFTIRRDTHNM